MNDTLEKIVRQQASKVNQLHYEHIPEMGLRNYWHPACLASEITEKLKAMTLMGTPVMLVRRNNKIYATIDECPHRGTRLSKGSCEFPGTNTITCRYHGWTFDVSDGALKAAITDGPDSPILQKTIRIKTFPLEDRHGIAWIWLSDEKPVPVEEDIPQGMRNATRINVVRRTTYGNWRWHVENPGLGHATMLHRDSMYMRFVDMFGFGTGFSAPLMTQGPDGEWLQERIRGYGRSAEFPGLGQWPVHRFGEVIPLAEMPPVQEVSTIVSVRLPGVIRVTNFPIRGAMYYEWFVQIEADHYIYFQVCCGFPQTFIEKMFYNLRFFFWGRFIGMIRFNKQDLAMVEDSHDYAKRKRFNDPAPLNSRSESKRRCHAGAG